MKEIKEVRCDNYNGSITDVKLDDGTQLTVEEAISRAENGEIGNVIVGKDKLDNKTLKSFPDGIPDNNLLNLKRF